MSSDIPTTYGRATALGFLAIPVILLIWFVSGLFVAHAQHHTRVAQLLQEHGHIEHLVQHAPQWRNQIAKLRDRARGTALFFDAAELNSAATRMQSEVSSAIAPDHVALSQNEIELKADNTSKRTELHLLLSFNADIATVTHVLFHLRQMHPLLFVRKLELRASPQPATGLASVPHLLQAELTVVGFVQSP